MSRRRQAVVAAVAAGMLLAAGCSSGDPEATPTAAPTQSGPTLLTFSVYGPPQVITAYAKIAANFTAEHPGTVVNVRPFDSAAAAHTDLEKQLAAGDPPDAFLAPLEDVPGLIRDKALRRVDELLGERGVDFGDGFQRYALEAFSSDNALQCMPVDASPLVVYYNADLIDLTTLFEAPGQRTVTPTKGWDLDQFALAARSVQAPGVRGVYVDPTLEGIAPFVLSGGGKLVDDDDDPTSLDLTDGSTSSALEKLLEVVRDPRATFNQKQISRVSALKRFETGKLAMILGYRNLTPELRQQANLNFNVLPVPVLGSKATIGQSSGLCLSSASEHPDKTADFLAYAVSDDASRLLAETGYTVPTNLDVVHSDAYLQPDQFPIDASVFSANVRYIEPLPTAPAWPAVEEMAAPLLTQLFFDPVIDPLDDRLQAIDDASEPLFAPPATQTPSPTPSPSPTN